MFIEDHIDTQGEIHEFTDVVEEAAYLTKLLSFIFLKIAPEQPELALWYRE